MAGLPEIPRLDFSLLYEAKQNGLSDTQARRQLAQELLNSLSSYGVAKIVNHGIPEAMITEAFNMSKRFYGLSPEAKAVAKHPEGANPHRGYARLGLERTYGLKNGTDDLTTRVDDHKVGVLARLRCFNEDEVTEYSRQESFDIGTPTDCSNANRWPREEDLPGFRNTMEQFFETCHETMTEIMVMLMQVMGISTEDIVALHSAKAHELRLTHYVAVPAKLIENGKKLRIAEHTDYGTITLLFQDTIGGLEVQNQTTGPEFIPILDASPTMIVNIGDSLQRWTNASLKAVVHRVVKPMRQSDDDEAILPARYSIAFFGKPNRDASLSPFPAFLSDERPCLYPHITAGDYNQSRLLHQYNHTQA
ncbi:hypothetical protein PDE_02134 [Penicillium oxalicum 114-2]|uniref:Fe2OG dioxygenase domain-containing protein n=1 Tax=Penicillium oxalicum (strain 114-2 / CGMCC 5302) TaxID=933388 RepID=S7ZET2_PENO1|nr:hypothetical protein PDE_02134 [Penicillium oxalicum 114-2]